MTSLIVILVVGGIVGWIASLIMKTSAQMGILANVAVGVVGSALGAWLFGALGLVAYGASGRFVMSIVGAVVLIWILKSLRVLK
jgi:uncharacterized membrane protein YeaQ/YmgE (transglycosylase-associated protein family)